MDAPVTPPETSKKESGCDSKSSRLPRPAEGSNELISFMCTPGSYPHPVEKVVHRETHISHIFLTGSFAYKIKKSVQLEFLDFTALASRKKYCLEEIRLNSRFAPELYLDVIPICRKQQASPTQSQKCAQFDFGTGGEIVEYAVKMLQFDENQQFLHLLQKGQLTEQHILHLTDDVVCFHSAAQQKSSFWGYTEIEAFMAENLTRLRQSTGRNVSLEKIKELEASWYEELKSCRQLISERQNTHVKALHGDLHLGNICIFQGRPTPFDGIEFNESYYCCDVWADFAFFLMDLGARGASELATVGLNRYLECGDDYAGLPLLNLYLAYRATVRAKVSYLSCDAEETAARKEKLLLEARNYIDFAHTSLTSNQGRVVAIGGLSGSGKSTLAKSLARRCGGIHINSDVVRKHLAGVPLSERAPDSCYEPEMNRRTYAGIGERALLALQTNRPVVLDATFQAQHTREEIRSLAQQAGVHFYGIWCEASYAVCTERLRQRQGNVSDADCSTLDRQLNFDTGAINWNIVNTASPADTVLNEVTSAMGGQ